MSDTEKDELEEVFYLDEESTEAENSTFRQFRPDDLFAHLLSQHICQFYGNIGTEDNMKKAEAGFWMHKISCIKEKLEFNKSSASVSATSVSVGASSTQQPPSKKPIDTGSSIGLSGPPAIDTTSVDTSLNLF